MLILAMRDLLCGITGQSTWSKKTRNGKIRLVQSRQVFIVSASLKDKCMYRSTWILSGYLALLVTMVSHHGHAIKYRVSMQKSSAQKRNKEKEKKKAKNGSSNTVSWHVRTKEKEEHVSLLSHQTQLDARSIFVLSILFFFSYRRESRDHRSSFEDGSVNRVL